MEIILMSCCVSTDRPIIVFYGIGNQNNVLTKPLHPGEEIQVRCQRPRGSLRSKVKLMLSCPDLPIRQKVIPANIPTTAATVSLTLTVNKQQDGQWCNCTADNGRHEAIQRKQIRVKGE